MISKDGSEESIGSLDGQQLQQAGSQGETQPQPRKESALQGSCTAAGDNQPLLLDPAKAVKAKKAKPALRREATKYPVDDAGGQKWSAGTSGGPAGGGDIGPIAASVAAGRKDLSTSKPSRSPSQTPDTKRRSKAKW